MTLRMDPRWLDVNSVRIRPNSTRFQKFNLIRVQQKLFNSESNYKVRDGSELDIINNPNSNPTPTRLDTQLRI